MQNVKVEQMRSTRGNFVANQFTITTDDGVYLQSYSSIIAFRPNGYYSGREKMVLDVNTWDYSRTTSKYRVEFLGESTKETKRKIQEGVYLLQDLNN